MATNLSPKTHRVASALVEQRRAPRYRVEVTRELRKRDFAVQDAQIYDVSIYGCRFVASGSFAEGERLSLKLAEDTPTPATVVWSDGTQVGCRFDEPIDRRVMRSLTLRLH